MFMINTLEDARKLVLGATILGTGGGGDPREGMKMMEEVISAGRSVSVVNLDEIPEDSVLVVPYFVGSIAPGLKTKKPVKIKDAIGRAFKEMENYLGKRIRGVVANEMGGDNTPVALNIAAKLNLPVIDGDLLGRAAPELHQCTVHIFDIPMFPSVIVTETGNVVVVKEYADIDDYESIARYLSVLGGRFSAVVDTPMGVDEAEKAVVKGTITLSYKLGDAVMKARKEGRDPVDAVVDVLGGWRVFQGVVEKYSWRDEGGFLRGEATIVGKGRFEGRLLRTWIMNEHIMVWLDNEPLVMPPDLFILLTSDGEPITNTELKEGMEVHGVASKAPEVWRTDKGLKFFGPRKFGFDYDYVPVEKLVERIIG